MRKVFDLSGDGLKLLETFLDYATQADNKELADAMFYDTDTLRERAKIIQESVINDADPQ